MVNIFLNTFVNMYNKYNLIGLSDECIREKNIQILRPDITSIIDALENDKNPYPLFITKDQQPNIEVIKEKLSDIHENLDDLKQWLDGTFIPNMQVSNGDLRRQIRTSVHLAETKMTHLTAVIKKLRKKCTRKGGLNFGGKQYEVFCPVCDKFYFLKNSEEWLELEKHDHIAEILSTGLAFHSSINENDDVLLEPKSLEEKHLNSIKELNSVKLEDVRNIIPINIYGSTVQKLLYPSKLMMSVCSFEKNFQFYTIQAISPSRYQCLMCQADMHQEKCIYTHVTGNKHKNKFSDRYICNRVINYHSVFSNLPEEIQIHQVVFKPSYKLEFLFCKVCSLQINSKKIVSHLNTDMHKLRLCDKRFSNYNFFNEMLRSLGKNPFDIEDLEIPQKSQLIYNSKITLQSVNESLRSKNDSPKDSVTTEDSEEKSSEISFQSPEEPAQGTSNDLNLQNNVQTNGKRKQEHQATKENIQEPIKHNVVLAFKENPSNMFDFLENRYQIHLEFIRIINSTPLCTLCMKSLSKTVVAIKKHFYSNEHKKLSEIHCGKQNYFYYCDLCYKNIRKEEKWIGHLMCNEHKQRVEAINSKQNPVVGAFKEYECTVCRIVIYGNNYSIKKHLHENLGNVKIPKKPKEIKLPPHVENLFKIEKLYAEEIYKLSKESTEVLNSIELSLDCCRAIERALEPVFGQCKAYPFGSRVSGLGNLVSDLDVFVDTGMMYDGIFYQDSENQARLVTQTTRALKKHADFADVFPIPHARTPIVQVFHKITGLDCDLSFRHGLSVENTEFLRLCIDVQPKLKTLILFLKRWSHLCKLSERISTYALSMLSIFFFQIKNLLPSVTQIRKMDPCDSKIIAGWQTFRFSRPLEEITALYPPSTLLSRQILCEFFEYYSKFRFNVEVVCPLMGNPILKTDFHEEKGKRLPPEMKTYVAKINENNDNEVFRSLSAMCIQDPFDLSHNLTKACPIDVVNKFITLCFMSYQMLNKTG